jgi:hypothetical protein
MSCIVQLNQRHFLISDVQQDATINILFAFQSPQIAQTIIM